MRKESTVERENYIIMMGVFIREIFLKEKGTVKENINT